MGYKVSGAFKLQQPNGCEDLGAMKSGLTEFVGSALDGKIRIEDGIQGFRGFQTAAT